MDPCEITTLTDDQGGETFEKTTLFSCQKDRKRKFPWIPLEESLRIGTRCQALSKALEISQNTSVNLPRRASEIKEKEG